MDVAFPEGARLPAAAATCALLTVAAWLWASPASPLALERADALLGGDRPHVAAARYDAIGAAHPDPETRIQALRRSAQVWSVALSEPAQSRRRLERVAELQGDPAARANTLDQVAELLAEERLYASAAATWREAHDLLPRADGAPERLLAAARARASAGDRDGASATYARVVRRHPKLRSEALIGRAELLLADGRVEEALPLFERARRTSDPALETVARLGGAACLERLGDLDEAIAQIDAADLPEDVRARRTGGMRERRDP